MKNLKSLEDVKLQGKKILLRVAYDITLAEENLPAGQAGGKMVVPDDMRIRATLPTINYLLEQGCSLALLSWLKRPGGKIVERLRMQPVAEKLSELLGRPVKALADCVGPDVKKEIAAMKPGDIILLENVRFHPEEEQADMQFAKQLCDGLEFIVYDAFAQAMRIHASTTGILQVLPAACGFLFQKEIVTLSHLLENPDHPFVALMGGAKISDRIGVMENLIEKADRILIGGALANIFFLAQGQNVEKSLVEDVYVDAARAGKKDYLKMCQDLLEKAQDHLQLPLDMLSAPSAESDAIKVVNIDEGEHLQAGWAYFDIGPRTVDLYSQILKAAKLTFANGPMGLFEIEQFAGGTKQVAEAMLASGATTVIGGGDTESIVARYGWEGRFTHVSTGGGASLEFLAGKEFPVMKYLVKK